MKVLDGEVRVEVRLKLCGAGLQLLALGSLRWKESEKSTVRSELYQNISTKRSRGLNSKGRGRWRDRQFLVLQHAEMKAFWLPMTSPVSSCWDAMLFLK